MKWPLLIIAPFFFIPCIHAQETNNHAAIPAENTFGLIIGIANYEHDRLNLNYANRDAEAFAAYLRSASGGYIPEDNIRLLTDTNATTAAIYQSLKWLKKKTELALSQDEKSKCLVYIYFSGHGDVETNTRANLGFLLAYNTPPNNYLNNAVRIEDLNDYAHTLSIDLNANVIIITDACHSGKLAGSDYRGSYLAGTALAAAKDKEVRIASCNPDQLSVEDPRWGDGRGVFSWYLINGLKGLADRNKDQIVTLNEARTYVDSCIAADEVLKELRHKQTPVIKGNQQFRLAAVNAEALQGLVSPAVPEKPVSLPDQFWNQLRNAVEDVSQIDFTVVQQAEKKDIPRVFIQEAARKWNDDSVARAGSSQLLLLLQQDTLLRNQFGEKLVEWIHNKGQEVINQYLSGDEAALEKRRYYNSKSNGYDSYPAMFATALKLLDANDPLNKILSMNQLYFSGVNIRLKLPLINEQQHPALIEQALAIQLKALLLDDNAAFIQNELGVLYQLKNDHSKAAGYYTSATALAPSWAIPYANLCGLYIQQKDIAKAAEAGAEAERLQPDLQNVHVNMGLLNESSANFLFAEERYKNAISINSRHFFPFERLGNLYLQTADYAAADSFYHEAALRKKGFHFRKNGSLFVNSIVVAPFFPELKCSIDTASLLKDDIMAFFYWGMTLYGNKAYAQAERVFKKIVALDTKNPLVFHYLGKVYYDQQLWEKAEIVFTMAFRNALPRDAFLRYCDSLVKGKRYPYDHSCFERYFRSKDYAIVEDYHFLGSLYERWNHPAEAEFWFRKIIQYEPESVIGYVKCWQLYEKQGRYPETEATIRAFSNADKGLVEIELNAFYRRMIQRFPDKAEWYHKLGILLYDIAALPNEVKYLDTIIYFPKINREIFIDKDIYFQLGKEPLVLDKNENGTPELFKNLDFIQPGKSFKVPGTDESIQLSEEIYTPRKDAIFYLGMADSLIMETNTKADINFKIGNVYVWSGSNKFAYPYYLQSVSLEPDNANARINLIDVCKKIYKHQTGMEQLTYLYEQGQINFEKRILYGEWCIRAGYYNKADTVLTEAKNTYPYPVPAISDLYGRMYLLKKEPLKAIPYYKAYAVSTKNDMFTLYSIARLYAQSGNKTESMKWLELSLQKGFNFSYVLNEDKAWESLRTTSQWSALLKKTVMKKYSEPAAGND